MGPHRHPRVSEGARASPSAPPRFSAQTHGCPCVASAQGRNLFIYLNVCFFPLLVCYFPLAGSLFSLERCLR